VNFEYFEIRNADDLKPVRQMDDLKELVILTALHVGKVRLIDNVLTKV
jgi:pantothenate synthetase